MDKERLITVGIPCSGSGVLNTEEGIEKFIVEDNKGVKLHPTT